MVGLVLHDDAAGVDAATGDAIAPAGKLVPDLHALGMLTPPAAPAPHVSAKLAVARGRGCSARRSGARVRLELAVTSRAEHRLLLRGDNADRRLTPIARELGLVDAPRAAAVAAKEARIRTAVDVLERTFRDGTSLAQRLRRPEVGIVELAAEPALRDLALRPDELSEVEAEVKYAGYIARQEAQVERMRRMDARRIPVDFDFATIAGVSAEGRERLATRRPLSVGEASRLPGVTPADLNLLLVALGARG